MLQYRSMLCSNPTPQEAEKGGNLALEQKRRLLVGMAVAVEGLRKLRSLKTARERHKRLYERRGHLIRAKAREFSKSERGRNYQLKYQRQRRRENLYVHFLNWLRGSVNRDLRRQEAPKSGRTEMLVGCSFVELKNHLEAQFSNEMSWKTRSEFDIDHFVPVSAFDLTDPEEQRWAFNWRNLRPMERLSNKTKSAKLPIPLPSWLPDHIVQRIMNRK